MRRAALSAEGGSFLRVWARAGQDVSARHIADCRKTLGELSGSPPLELSIVLSSMYGWCGTIVAVAPIFQSKTREGSTRLGACIPVHQLVKTFFDKQGRLCKAQRHSAAPPPESSREPNPHRTSYRPQRPVRRDNPGGEYSVSGAKRGGDAAVKPPPKKRVFSLRQRQNCRRGDCLPVQQPVK